MKKLVECTITEEIVANTSFIGLIHSGDTTPCYAMQAIMDATGLSHLKAIRVYYLNHLEKKLSTCGNKDFSEDLQALDRDQTEMTVPKLPLVFTIVIDD